eukprot:TCALIF_07610-PA protein Name:"Similar to cyb5r4 Cytochrome b5 reductase 4 (Danio rerio)" AED:0.08 eAED:0.08 QI:276/0.71/0.75/1/0.71/0.75/8/43/588
MNPAFSVSTTETSDSDSELKPGRVLPPKWDVSKSVSPSGTGGLGVPTMAGSSLGVPTPGGLFPLGNSQQVVSGSATGNPRNKVALKPGFSLMDWIRLTKSGRDLTGTGGKILKVTKTELAKHNKRKDAWMAINGVVYNVTAYMDYHPGGWDELVRGAGIDATNLFNEVHRWVNYESMLAACVVGKLVDADEVAFKLPPKSKGPSSFSSLSTNSSLSAKPVIPPIKSKPQLPSIDTHQTDLTFVISVFTRVPNQLQRENIIIEILEKVHCYLSIRIPNQESEDQPFRFLSEYTLHDKARLGKVTVVTSTGKVEIVLKKESKSHWPNLGQIVEGFPKLSKAANLETRYRDWALIDRKTVTHDVDHLILEPLPNLDLHFFVPVGHHIHTKCLVEGMEIVRSYTPILANLDPFLIDDGKLHFLIKTYSHGALTPMLKALEKGQTIPISDHTGSFDIHTAFQDVRQLILVAAGTGFTPMAKLLQQFLVKKHETKSVCQLLFFNKTEQDIMCREQLKGLEIQYPIFKVHHILSQDEKWTGLKGRISREILDKVLPENPKRRLVTICGPGPFAVEAKKLFQDMDAPEGSIFHFQG